MKKGRVKNIELTTCWFRYQPSYCYTPECDFYFGNEESGVPLMFNFKTNLFELNINPYGSKCGIALSKLEVMENDGGLAIEATDGKTCKSFILRHTHQSDQVLIRLLKELHGHGISQKDMKPDDTHIHIGLKNGMLIELRTTEYNEEYNIIPLKGVDVRVQEYDSEGNPDCTDNLLRKRPIVAEDFVYLDYSNSSSHTIKNLYIKDGWIISETTDKLFKDRLNTVDVVKDVIRKVLEVSLAFKSKYQ